MMAPTPTRRTVVRLAAAMYAAVVVGWIVAGLPQ